MDRSNARVSPHWRKSSASKETDCVEVATLGSAVLVRDSRARSAGTLVLASAQWGALVTTIRSGELDAR